MYFSLTDYKNRSECRHEKIIASKEKYMEEYSWVAESKYLCVLFKKYFNFTRKVKFEMALPNGKKRAKLYRRLTNVPYT